MRPGQPPTSSGTLPNPTPTQATKQKPAGTQALLGSSGSCPEGAMSKKKEGGEDGSGGEYNNERSSGRRRGGEGGRDEPSREKRKEERIRERPQPIFCEAPMHDEERHGDGDGSAIRLEGDNEGD
ncbi:hypothetical protein ALC62_00342 [Cyphomyrmex costatus]|uniref:Uncharacterized protein n=1 Tax=Cyphomyrmex costatus TaxID=456900 RepID=A0A195D719_9HYME|nr:hypothetical protein ALC62_00342 [Cyphomyrmex costatus]